MDLQIAGAYWPLGTLSKPFRRRWKSGMPNLRQICQSGQGGYTELPETTQTRVQQSVPAYSREKK